MAGLGHERRERRSTTLLRCRVWTLAILSNLEFPMLGAR
jgi:hypothetical protein